MHVFVESRDFKTKVNLPSGAKVLDVFRSLRLSEETHLASLDGVLVTGDELLKDGASLKLLPVVSGG
ncbi:MoaD/ThiS family protein [archaeon]|nr:MoaD/ThiS family protein [archaeon]